MGRRVYFRMGAGDRVLQWMTAAFQSSAFAQGRAHWCCFRLPMPWVDPEPLAGLVKAAYHREKLFADGVPDRSMLWSDGTDGRQFSTVGAVQLLEVGAQDDLSMVRHALRSFHAQLEQVDVPTSGLGLLDPLDGSAGGAGTDQTEAFSRHHAPWMVGGLPFDRQNTVETGRPGDFGGKDFGSHGRFWIPRWFYERSRGGERGGTGAGRVCLVLGREEVLRLEKWSRAFRDVVQGLTGSAVVPDASHAQGFDRRPVAPLTERTALQDKADQDGGRGAWNHLVSKALTGIGQGRLQKVVPVRQVYHPLDLPYAPDALGDALFRALRAGSPSCTSFVFQGASGDVFAGTTPETLFRTTSCGSADPVGRRGIRVTAEAVAGSVSLDDGGDVHAARERLISSDKNLREHEFVATEMARVLGGLCSRVQRGDRSVRELPHLLHLRTPFESELLAGKDAVDVLDRLHPTPAVAGYPVGAAIQWIREEEPHSRGWFSAPVGWLDAGGESHFVVALRSGWVSNQGALLCAGAGIVDGSEANSEYRETEVKMQTMLDVIRSVQGAQRSVAMGE